MSKIKNPQEKKRKSLQNDCRNTYGENSKASRNSIPKSKARRHQQERQAVNQPLKKIDLSVENDEIETVIALSEAKLLLKNRGGFTKYADKPLSLVIVRKKERREKLVYRRKPKKLTADLTVTDLATNLNHLPDTD